MGYLYPMCSRPEPDGLVTPRAWLRALLAVARSTSARPREAYPHAWNRAPVNVLKMRADSEEDDDDRQETLFRHCNITPEEARFRFIQTYLQDEVTIGSVPTAISGIRALAMFLR